MADYKRLYNTMQQMVDKYQNEIVPELRKEIEKIAKERDAAVADLKEMCAECSDDTLCCNYCKYQEDGLQCHHDCKMYTKEWDWQWRGVCDENIMLCISAEKSQEGK